MGDDTRAGNVELRPWQIDRINRAELVARFAVLGLILLAAAQSIYAVRGMYADGSYYLWRILGDQTFFLHTSRWVAQFVTQLPVVGAMALGVDDVVVLAHLQSLGTAALPLIVWSFALFILRRHRTFWLMAVIFAVTFLNSSFTSVGEYNFASAFVALSAAVLLLGVFKPWQCRVLMASAALLPFSYESLVFQGPLLIGMALIRLKPLVGRWRTEMRTIFSLAVAIFFYLAATTVSIIFIVFPRDATNLGGATNFLWPLLNDRQLVVSGGIGTLYILVSLTRPAVQKVATVGLCVGALVLLMPTLWSAPWMSYASRSVTGIALFVLLGVVAFDQFRVERRAGNGEELARKSGRLWIAGAVLLVVQLVPITVYTHGFLNWTKGFETTVSNASGVLTSEQTVGVFANASLFQWPWTNPFMSILLSTSADSAVVLSPGQIEGQQLPERLPSRFYKSGSLFIH